MTEFERVSIQLQQANLAVNLQLLKRNQLSSPAINGDEAAIEGAELAIDAAQDLIETPFDCLAKGCSENGSR